MVQRQLRTRCGRSRVSDNAKIERFSVKTAKPGSHEEPGFGFAWFFFRGALPPLQFAAVQDGFACLGVDEAEGRFALFQLPEVELDGGVGVEDGLHGREHPSQLLRVAGEELGGGQAADVAVGAQVMDERPVQAPAHGNVPVHVDEVRVAGEAVEQVLRRADVVVDDKVGVPLRDGAGPAGHGLAAVAAQGGEEGGAAVGAEQGAALVKDLDLGAHGHAPALAPVEEVGQHIPVDKGAFDGRDGAVVQKLIVQVDVRALRPEQLLHQHRDGAGAGELGGHVHRALSLIHI